MYNNTEVIGYLGHHATIRDVTENRKVISLRIGTTSHYLSNGKQTSHTEWFNIEAFCSDRQADYFARYGRKGALVHASGETRTQTWTDTEGREHSRTVVLAAVNNLHILKPPVSRHEYPAPQEAPEPRQERPLLQESVASQRMDLMNFD